MFSTHLLCSVYFTRIHVFSTPAYVDPALTTTSHRHCILCSLTPGNWMVVVDGVKLKSKLEQFSCYSDKGYSVRQLEETIAMKLSSTCLPVCLPAMERQEKKNGNRGPSLWAIYLLARECPLRIRRTVPPAFAAAAARLLLEYIAARMQFLINLHPLSLGCFRDLINRGVFHRQQ